MERELITFDVSIEVPADPEKPNGPKKKQWLKADGTFSSEKSEAFLFSLYRASTVAERIKLDMAMHDMCGGLSLFLDLKEGIDNAEQSMVDDIKADLWPEGPPDTADMSQKELTAMQKAIDDRFKGVTGRVKEGWRHMCDIRDRLAFLAGWKVLAVNIPNGWKSIGDVEISEEAFYAVWGTYMMKLGEADPGNASSSKSSGVSV